MRRIVIAARTGVHANAPALIWPELVENAARLLEPHHLPYYARDLASVFSAFYRDCRVINDEPALLGLTKARLKLVKAAQIVLANSLALMGLGAPEQM